MSCRFACVRKDAVLVVCVVYEAAYLHVVGERSLRARRSAADLPDSSTVHGQSWCANGAVIVLERLREASCVVCVLLGSCGEI